MENHVRFDWRQRRHDLCRVGTYLCFASLPIVAPSCHHPKGNTVNSDFSARSLTVGKQQMCGAAANVVTRWVEVVKSVPNERSTPCSFWWKGGHSFEKMRHFTSLCRVEELFRNSAGETEKSSTWIDWHSSSGINPWYSWSYAEDLIIENLKDGKFRWKSQCDKINYIVAKSKYKEQQMKIKMKKNRTMMKINTLSANIRSKSRKHIKKKKTR